MKKILSLIGLIILSIGLMTPFSYTEAAEMCNWRMQQTVSTGMASTQTGGCFAGENQIFDVLKIPEKCATANKPAENVIPGGTEKPLCCCVVAQTTVVKTSPKFVLPELQININTLKLTEPTCSNNSDGTYSCQIPWLGQYIIAIYNYGIGVAGILAAIMLMAGGVLWLVSAGDAGKIGQAQELIVGSVTGLVILAASYIILMQINPDLTKFKAISIGMIEGSVPEPADTSSFSANCTPQTTGNCAVSNMAIFGEKASEASAICNAESGGNAEIYNSLTRCDGGEYAVWGLFQFNLSANNFTDGTGTVLNCYKAFNHPWTNKNPNCIVVDAVLYNKCVTAAKSAELSIKNAQILSSAAKTRWGPWEANAKWCHFY